MPSFMLDSDRIVGGEAAHPQFHGKLLFCLVLSNIAAQLFWMPLLYCALHIVMFQLQIKLGLARLTEKMEDRFETLPKFLTTISIIPVLSTMILLFLNWIVHWS